MPDRHRPLRLVALVGCAFWAVDNGLLLLTDGGLSDAVDTAVYLPGFLLLVLATAWLAVRLTAGPRSRPAHVGLAVLVFVALSAVATGVQAGVHALVDALWPGGYDARGDDAGLLVLTAVVAGLALWAGRPRAAAAPVGVAPAPGRPA